MKILAAILTLILAGAASADPLYLPVSADFEVRAYQYAVESSAWNTPTIRLYPFQGATPIDPSTYSWVYRFGESEYTTSMVTIAGSAGSNYVDFAITGADFSQPCYRWYSAFRAVSGTTVVTFARGYLTIANSPEVTAASYVIRTSPTGTTTWVESIVSTDGSVVNRGDSVDQDLSVSNYVHQRVTEVSTGLQAQVSSTSNSLQSQITGVSTLAYPKAQSDAKYATTDRVEQVAALVGGGSTSSYTKAESDARYATTNELAVLSLKVDTATNNLATVLSWGNHATNGYAVNGQNITGRWFTVGNSVSEFATDAVISGGTNNSIGTANYAAIGGGEGNSIGNVGHYSFIGGGNDNSIAEDYSVICGGLNNSTIGSAWGFIGGGHNNSASADYGAVLGGYSGEAVGQYSVVLGGSEGSAGGDYATVAGGQDNEASGEHSFAGGRSAKATHAGAFVWSSPAAGELDADFSSSDENTFNVRSVGGGYFLMPFLRLMDTNGVQWAYLSPTGGLQIGAASFHAETSGDIWHDPTNTAVLGILSASSIKNTNGTPVLYVGEAPTISLWSAATTRLAAAEALVAAMTAQVASLIAQIPALSNYVVASDSTITGLVASTTAALSSTNDWLFTQVTNRDHTVTTGLQATVAANLSTFSTFTNSYSAAITNVDAVTFGGTIKSGFMLASAWEDIRTNVLFGFLDTVAATNSAGAQNYLKYSSTNTWLHDGTSWRWWSRYGF